MSKSKLKIYKLGIVGAGFMAKEYLKVIKSNKHLKVTCITSRTIKKAKLLAKIFKIPVVNNDINSLAKKNNIDGIMILVSPESIFKVTKEAINLDVPFFLEKPPGLNFRETNILNKLASKKKLLNMVCFNRRHYSIFKKGMEIINKKGQLIGISIEGHERFWNVEKNYSKKIKESWIYANSIHTIDLLRFFGGDIKKVFSLKKNLIQKKGDQFVSAIEFKNGIIGNYISHWYSPGGWTIKLFGKGVTVEFKPLEKGYVIDKNFNFKEIKADKYDKKFKAGLFRQIDSFRTLISSGKLIWPSQNLNDSLKTMLLIKRINRND